MKRYVYLMILAGLLGGLSACGDKKDSAARDQEVQKVMQEGMQKEKSMMEGMQKGVENMEKKATEQKEEAKR